MGARLDADGLLWMPDRSSNLARHYYSHRLGCWQTKRPNDDGKFQGGRTGTPDVTEIVYHDRTDQFSGS